LITVSPDTARWPCRKVTESHYEETVITSFPQRWGKHAASTETTTTINMTNVLDDILRHLAESVREPFTSAFGLSETIIARCLGLSFDPVEWYYEQYLYLEIFEYSINYVVSESQILKTGF
jgi:hypothetical protein